MNKKRLLIFNEEGFYKEEYIVDAWTVPTENQYLAELDEVITFHRPKLFQGVIIEGKEEWEFKEEELNASLTPSPEEQAQAEWEIKTINLLIDLEVLI